MCDNWRVLTDYSPTDEKTRPYTIFKKRKPRDDGELGVVLCGTDLELSETKLGS